MKRLNEGERKKEREGEREIEMKRLNEGEREIEIVLPISS